MTSYTYGPYRNVLTQTDPLCGLTTNTYDSNNNVVSRTDPLGRTTSFRYDASNPKTSEPTPRATVWHCACAAAGQQASQADSNGNTTSFCTMPQHPDC